MCALQRFLRREVSPQGPEALEGEGPDRLPAGGESPRAGRPRGEPPSGPFQRLRSPVGVSPSGGTLQAVGLVLSRFVDAVACAARGEWAMHTLESTGPTVAPGPMMGTSRPIGTWRSVMGPIPQAKRRGAQNRRRSVAGPQLRAKRRGTRVTWWRIRGVSATPAGTCVAGGGHHARHDLHYRASVTARTGLKAARCPSRSHYPVLSCLSSPSVLRLLDSRLQ